MPLAVFSQEKEKQGKKSNAIVFDCVGPVLRFVDKNLSEVEHVQIATWEDSFNPDGKLKPDFYEVDEERFYIEVIYEDAVGDQLIVNLESYKEGVDPSSGAFVDNQIAVTLQRDGTTSLFRSAAT